MTHRLFGVLVGAFLALLPLAAEAKVKVVATIPSLAAIAKEVGGDDVEVTSLSFATQDPHFVDARPHLVLALNRADLLVLNGLELETGWLPVLLTGARNAGIQPGTKGYLDTSTLVPLKEIPRQKIDRSMGDIHPGGNPHYLTDPRNGARVARGIADRLAATDVANAADYRRRATALSRAAEALASRETKRYADLPVVERHVVTYHRSLLYFLDWLGLMEIGTIEPKPGISPDPGHIAWLLGHMRKVHADVILQESYYSSRIGKLLAEKAKATLAVLPGGANFEKGETYLGYIARMSETAYQAVASGADK